MKTLVDYLDLLGRSGGSELRVSATDPTTLVRYGRPVEVGEPVPGSTWTDLVSALPAESLAMATAGWFKVVVDHANRALTATIMEPAMAALRHVQDDE